MHSVITGFHNPILNRMMISTYFLISLLASFQFKSNLVLGQRTFVNPAVTDPAPCACNLQTDICQPNCCCDSDCTEDDLRVSPVCKSTRTTSSYLSSEEQSLQTWNCSNSTSSDLYDYFPFVCVQLKQNEVIGQFYPTNNVTFIREDSNPADFASIFSTQYPELFQSTTLVMPSTTSYSIGVPIRESTSNIFTLPGNLVGSGCEEKVNVLFGVNRDVTCPSFPNLCNYITSTTSIQSVAGSTSSLNIIFFQKTFVTPSTPSRTSTPEYYFQDLYSLTIYDANGTLSIGSVLDYCPLRHPLSRTQRYFSVCTSSTGCNSNNYQTYSGCSLRNNFAYNAIPTNFFSARMSSVDGATNFADFVNATNPTSISCGTNDIRRVFYRFNYSSTDNTISSVEAFVLLQSGSTTMRITIEWNDIAVNPATNTTIPRGYLTGETLQFRRNDIISDVSSLVPSASGYCVDATRKMLRYKQDFSSQCFVQLNQNTIKNCHTLKLNMYLYLNVFYAPASHVLSYPSPNATQIPIRDNAQDSLDLDRIDETRLNNQLNVDLITRTRLNQSTPTIYDTAQNLPICFDVPSGVYIEFGYVRVPISRTVSYERIVSVRYNYTYSTWQFTCNAISCPTTTQKYLVTFQSAFVDYTNAALNLSDVTRSDLTSADNYVQHLLWLITPEYKGEPGYRNYTIAMILIFIAISAVVMHILLFGVMCPF